MPGSDHSIRVYPLMQGGNAIFFRLRRVKSDHFRRVYPLLQGENAKNFRLRRAKVIILEGFPLCYKDQIQKNRQFALQNG